MPSLMRLGALVAVVLLAVAATHALIFEDTGSGFSMYRAIEGVIAGAAACLVFARSGSARAASVGLVVLVAAVFLGSLLPLTILGSVVASPATYAVATGLCANLVRSLADRSGERRQRVERASAPQG